MLLQMGGNERKNVTAFSTTDLVLKGFAIPDSSEGISKERSLVGEVNVTGHNSEKGLKDSKNVSPRLPNKEEEYGDKYIERQFSPT